MEGSTEPILDQLVEACREILEIAVNVKGMPEESELLQELRKTATKALATARGLQICEGRTLV